MTIIHNDQPDISYYLLWLNSQDYKIHKCKISIFTEPSVPSYGRPLGQKRQNKKTKKQKQKDKTKHKNKYEIAQK